MIDYSYFAGMIDASAVEIRDKGQEVRVSFRADVSTRMIKELETIGAIGWHTGNGHQTSIPRNRLEVYIPRPIFTRIEHYLRLRVRASF